MNTQNFQVGEIVKTSFPAARVTAVDVGQADDQVTVHIGSQVLTLDLSGDVELTVERVAPPEWPPQVGDLWSGSGGMQWLVQRYHAGGGWRGERMVPADDGVSVGVDTFLSDYGPVKLEHRKGWSPRPAVEVQASAAPSRTYGNEDPTAHRAAIVAGLRELADVFEAGDVPIPTYTVSVGYGLSDRSDQPAAVARLRRLAEVLGVEVTESLDADGDRHWSAERAFGAAKLRVYCIEYQPQPEVPAAAESSPDQADEPQAGEPGTADAEPPEGGESDAC